MTGNLSQAVKRSLQTLLLASRNSPVKRLHSATDPPPCSNQTEDSNFQATDAQLRRIPRIDAAVFKRQWVMRTRELCGRSAPSLEGLRALPPRLLLSVKYLQTICQKNISQIEIPAEEQPEERTYLLELKVKLQDPL